MTMFTKLVERGKKIKAHLDRSPDFDKLQPSSSTVGSNETQRSEDHHRVVEMYAPPEPPFFAGRYYSQQQQQHGQQPQHGQQLPHGQQVQYVQQQQNGQQQQHGQQQQYGQQQQHGQQQQQQRNSIAAQDTKDQARHANEAIAQQKQRQRNASADNVRRLRELIRERYALDLLIWDHRDVQPASRKRIKPMCKRADAILQEIYFIVNDWSEDLFNEQEWQMAKRIKERLPAKYLETGESGEPAIWGDLAPWDRLGDKKKVARHSIVSGAGSDEYH